MENRTIKFLGDITVDSDQLSELKSILDIQNTTDREKPGNYIHYGEHGTYDYFVDEEYDIYMVDIK